MRDRMSWLVFAVVSIAAVGCATIWARSEPAPGSPSASSLEGLLSAVRVIDARPNVPGYQRSCKADQACVFGPAWTDDSNAPGGHDGCDTRNNVLGEQLTDVTYRPNTRDCVVLTGVLDDPYTGQRLEFTKAQAGDIQVDHVYPLAAAWDMGAANWSLEKRVEFANDTTYELLAIDGDTNQSKSDSTPGDWLPPHPAYHCFYAAKYLTVAVQYGLPITRDDERTLREVAQNCPADAPTPQ